MSDVDEARSRRLTTFVALLRSYPKQLELCRARQQLAFVRGSLRDSTTVRHLVVTMGYYHIVVTVHDATHVRGRHRGGAHANKVHRGSRRRR